MSLGVKYTFPVDVYPRYSYLKGWTLKLLDRFKAKIKKNHFEECVSQGFTELEDIIAAGQSLSQPEVTIFAQDKKLVPSLTDDLVQTMEPFRHQRLNYEKISWNDFEKDSTLRNEFDSKILVVIAKERDNVSSTIRLSMTQEMKAKLKQLPEVQQRNTFIYNPDTEIHKLLAEDITDQLPTKDVHQKQLSWDIQSLLERKVVTLLQKMEAYMDLLVPRERKEPKKSLLDDVKYTIKNFEICCLKELMGEKVENAYIDSQGRFTNVKQKKRKRENSKDNEQTGNYAEPENEEQTESKDEYLTRQLSMKEGSEVIKFIERRTRCKMIQHLSRKYGIRAMVLNTFLTSEMSFNYTDKFARMVEKEKMTTLDSLEQILEECHKKISHLVLDVEKFVKEQYEELEVIQRQQFELYGILRQTNYDVKIREVAKLDPELQDKLLGIKEVTGCGIIYGILTLHASSNLSDYSKDDVMELLRKYNYFNGYKVNVVSSKIEQAGTSGFIEIDNGTALKAELSSSDQSKFGTLGVFVDVADNSDNKQQENTMTSVPAHQKQTLKKSNVQSSTSPKRKSGKKVIRESDKSELICQQQVISESTLHCVTCRHCVKDCKKEIKTKHGNGVIAEQTRYFIESGDRYDVALLKILPEKVDNCTTKLWMGNKDNDTRCCWEILNNSKNLASRPVFKYGSQSKYTCGVIASDNYKERQIIGKRRSQGWTNADHFLDRTVNVIIVGSDNGCFSTDGDSGSVICDRKINNLTVMAISLLHGALQDNDKWICTYSALLRQTFNELEKRCGITIKIPEFESPGVIEDPFAALKIDEAFNKEPEPMQTSQANMNREQERGQPERMETEEGAVGGETGPKAEKPYYKPSVLYAPADESKHFGSRQQSRNRSSKENVSREKKFKRNF